jgi:hypothetical protein
MRNFNPSPLITKAEKMAKSISERMGNKVQKPISAKDILLQAHIEELAK